MTKDLKKPLVEDYQQQTPYMAEATAKATALQDADDAVKLALETSAFGRDPAPVKAGGHPVAEMNVGDGAFFPMRGVEDQEIASVLVADVLHRKEDSSPSADAAERGTKTGSLSASPSGAENVAIRPETRSS